MESRKSVYEKIPVDYIPLSTASVIKPQKATGIIPTIITGFTTLSPHSVKWYPHQSGDLVQPYKHDQIDQFFYTTRYLDKKPKEIRWFYNRL